jgi:hypothetical protein
LKTRRSLGVGAALWVASALASAPVASHPWDSGVIKPTTFAATVLRMQVEMSGIEPARAAGDLADVAQRAQRMALLADQVPGFALTLPGALRDSAVGAVMRVSLDLRATASALGVAADRGDSAGVALHAPRLLALCAALEAHAPRQYVCPMHCEPGQIYDRPGSCPKCGMSLKQITSDRYSVEVTPASGPLRAGTPTTLDFQIKDPAGFDAAHLQVVHEKLLHLMMVSQDLSWFSHEHPIPQGNGSFRLRTSFPVGGTYVLFHDFTPDSVGMQVVPVELNVEGRARKTKTLVVDDDKPKRIDGYEISLSHTPLAPTIACAMTYTLTRHGEPVTDLEPFLGAMGHLVMISRDRTAYVHSHPLDSQMSGGPSVQFITTFEKAGLYKAWAQFQRHGQVLTVPFVVEVGSGAVSAAR